MMSLRHAVPAAATALALSLPCTARADPGTSTWRFLGEPWFGAGGCIDEHCSDVYFASGLTLLKYTPARVRIFPRVEAFALSGSDDLDGRSHWGSGARISAELPWLDLDPISAGLLLGASMEGRFVRTQQDGSPAASSYMKLVAGTRVVVPRGWVFLLPQVAYGVALGVGDSSRPGAVEWTIGLGLDRFLMGGRAGR